jgi:hypothetical protein
MNASEVRTVSDASVQLRRAAGTRSVALLADDAESAVVASFRSPEQPAMSRSDSSADSSTVH